MAILNTLAESCFDRMTSNTWHIDQLHAKVAQVHMVIEEEPVMCRSHMPFGWVGRIQELW